MEDTMNIVIDEFAKELSEVLNKHKVSLSADKSGIYLVKAEYKHSMAIGYPSTASEEPEPRLIIVMGDILPK